MSKRKPGGQPSNTNALKAGVYSTRFHPLELADLEVEVRQGLEDEIAMMREQIHRLVYYSKDENSIKSISDNLNTLGTAATKLANLIRTQQALHSRTNEISSILSQAITEGLYELKQKYA